MYGIFTYIWAIYGVNGGKYSIHGAHGNGVCVCFFSCFAVLGLGLGGVPNESRDALALPGWKSAADGWAAAFAATGFFCAREKW